MIVRRLGFKIVRRRWKSLIRQTAAATFFVALVFTLICLNVAFNATFHKAEEQVGYGPIIITPTEIRLPFRSVRLLTPESARATT